MELIESKILRLEDQHIELLDDTDKEHLHCYSGYYYDFLKINNQIYKTKKSGYKDCFLEILIGEEVSKYFRLQTTDSIVARQDGKIILINSLFTEKGKNI